MKSANTKTILTVAMAVLFIFAAGCDQFNKALEDLTTQEVDFYQGIYDGWAVRDMVSKPIANDVVVANAGPVEANSVYVTDIAENILALQSGAQELIMGLSGTARNIGGTTGRVYVFFAPSSAPAESESLLIGSFVINAGATLQFVDSQGFDQTPEEVQDNIETYFDANPTNEMFHVFLYCENVAEGAVAIENLNLDSTPAFSWFNLIPADFISGSSENLKGINSVGVSGTFTNNGDAPARFRWVVGSANETLDADNNLIIDVLVQPGHTVEASSGLVVPEGLQRLKSQLKDLAGGTSIKGNLAVASDSVVNIEINEFRVEMSAEVGI